MTIQAIIDRHLKKKTIISFLLCPFSLIFAFIVIIRRFIYTTFPNLSYCSKVKIISVGNITSGGSGKTPYVLYLASTLKEKHKIAIVSRGYKSKLENENTLIDSTNVHLAGDEVFLYAHHLPNIPICIGKNRTKSIKLLENKYPDLEYIIMDDAFQHLQVRQDNKICVFNVLNPIGNGFCLPAGILREPIRVLKYADTFVINGDIALLDKKVLSLLKKFNKPIQSGDYVISELRDFQNNIVELSSLKNKRIMLLSGIGLPQSFEKTVSKAGISYEGHYILNDHFEYDQNFLDSHQEEFCKYDYILTTEKDYCKLCKLKTNLPIIVVRIGFIIIPDGKTD